MQSVMGNLSPHFPNWKQQSRGWLLWFLSEYPGAAVVGSWELGSLIHASFPSGHPRARQEVEGRACVWERRTCQLEQMAGNRVHQSRLHPEPSKEKNTCC